MAKHTWYPTARVFKYQGKTFRECRCAACGWLIDVPEVKGVVKHGVPSRRATCVPTLCGKELVGLTVRCAAPKGHGGMHAADSWDRLQARCADEACECQTSVPRPEIGMSSGNVSNV